MEEPLRSPPMCETSLDLAPSVPPAAMSISVEGQSAEGKSSYEEPMLNMSLTEMWKLQEELLVSRARQYALQEALHKVNDQRSSISLIPQNAGKFFSRLRHPMTARNSSSEETQMETDLTPLEEELRNAREELRQSNEAIEILKQEKVFLLMNEKRHVHASLENAKLQINSQESRIAELKRMCEEYGRRPSLRKSSFFIQVMDAATTAPEQTPFEEYIYAIGMHYSFGMVVNILSSIVSMFNQLMVPDVDLGISNLKAAQNNRLLRTSSMPHLSRLSGSTNMQGAIFQAELQQPSEEARAVEQDSSLEHNLNFGIAATVRFLLQSLEPLLLGHSHRSISCELNYNDGSIQLLNQISQNCHHQLVDCLKNDLELRLAEGIKETRRCEQRACSEKESELRYLFAKESADKHKLIDSQRATIERQSHQLLQLSDQVTAFKNELDDIDEPELRKQISDLTENLTEVTRQLEVNSAAAKQAYGLRCTLQELHTKYGETEVSLASEQRKVKELKYYSALNRDRLSLLCEDYCSQMFRTVSTISTWTRTHNNRIKALENELRALESHHRENLSNLRGVNMFTQTEEYDFDPDQVDCLASVESKSSGDQGQIRGSLSMTLNGSNQDRSTNESLMDSLIMNRKLTHQISEIRRFWKNERDSRVQVEKQLQESLSKVLELQVSPSIASPNKDDQSPVALFASSAPSSMPRQRGHQNASNSGQQRSHRLQHFDGKGDVHGDADCVTVLKKDIDQKDAIIEHLLRKTGLSLEDVEQHHEIASRSPFFTSMFKKHSPSQAQTRRLSRSEISKLVENYIVENMRLRTDLKRTVEELNSLTKEHDVL